MQQIKWIDRKFSFDFSIQFLPNIIERLRSTPIRIEQMVLNITDEKLKQKFENKWSIKELIGHLSDIEDLHLKRIDDFILRKKNLCAADMSNTKTNEGNYNLTNINHLLNNFTSKRNLFISLLKKLNDETQNFKSLHPRLQVLMRPIDIAYFVAEHDDNHLCSIREILNQSKNNE